MTFRKRGLSPVIATMLLVSLALVLAVIIYFWARSFIGESISKQGSAIELLCDDVSFEASISSDKVNVENLGDVPIYAIEVRKEGFGDVSSVAVNPGTDSVTSGQTKSFTLDQPLGSGVYLVIPILLGESEGNTKAHTCDKDYGYEVVIP